MLPAARVGSQSRIVVAPCLVALSLALGCASVPPTPVVVTAQYVVEVASEPQGATVRRGESLLGAAPLRVEAASIFDVLELVADQPGLELVERRIRVLGEGDLQVLFRFGNEPTALARALGLGRVTVFDYSGSALFDVDQAVIRPEARPLVAAQARVLTGPFATVPVFACGHTDDTGGELHNLELSLARAAALADLLVDEGVDRSRLTVQGFGWQYPVATNADELGRSLNRRAEIVLPDASP